MKKTLVISAPGAGDITLNVLNAIEDVDVVWAFPPTPLFMRALRRLALSRGIVFKGLWFDSWKNALHSYDVVVCIASYYSPAILNWIHKKNHNAKLINYYWDKIVISGYPIVQSPNYSNWSFDAEDCRRFGFTHNPQYYIDGLIPKADSKCYDISFVGSDRGGHWESRGSMVDKCFQEFERQGFNSFFYYVSSDPRSNPAYSHDELLDEEEYYRVVSQSMAVLEIVEPDSGWITLRPLQALTNGIKLITNNMAIINEPYYDERNVFILGMRDNGELRSFINSPFHPIPQEAFKHFEARAWIDRFRELK